MTRFALVPWLLLVGVLALGLSACGDDATKPLDDGAPKQPPADAGKVDDPSAGPWIAEVIYDGGTKLGGCAIGELDAQREGREVVTVDGEGRVHLVYRDGDGWGSQVLADLPGEMIQCAIGDCHPDHPGNEIVTVGMAAGTEDDGGNGAVHVFVNTQLGWEHRVVSDAFPALVHGVAVADMDEGGRAEIVAVGFDQKATILRALKDGTWRTVHQAGIHGPGKAAVGYKKGVAVAVAGGLVALVQHHSHSPDGKIGIAGWSVDKVAEGPSQARIGTDGERLLLAGDDGVLRLLTRNPGPPATWSIDEVHKEGQKLRGAAFGDFDPTHEGLEAASAGYEGKVVVLTLLYGKWMPTVVYEDGQKLHHLASGDVVPGVAGDELVTCGYSGKLVLIRRR